MLLQVVTLTPQGEPHDLTPSPQAMDEMLKENYYGTEPLPVRTPTSLNDIEYSTQPTAGASGTVLSDSLS